jgi:hypothetical protein
LANATRTKTWSWWSMVQASTRARRSLCRTTCGCTFCPHIHPNSIHKSTSGRSCVRSIYTIVYLKASMPWRSTWQWR